MRFAPEQPQPKGAMDNQELIRTLDRDHLLAVVELLSQALICENDDFDDLQGGTLFLTDEVWNYCKDMSGYQRLKVMQLIINTLIHEAEQSTVRHFQALLPLKSEQFYRP